MKTSMLFSLLPELKKLLYFIILTVLSNCTIVLGQTTETNPRYWTQYDNKELGISFKHPTNWIKGNMRDGLYLYAPLDNVGTSENPQMPNLNILKVRYGRLIQNILKSEKFIVSKIGEYRSYESDEYIKEYGWLTTVIEVEKEKVYFMFNISPYGENEPWGPKIKDIFIKILDSYPLKSPI
ncbi:MAG: hypothetical protein A2V93_03600 [Ignavibacteria bacterium RBG_16_34_14]|nr:MAG: hypothetical protein A2V93_03600 [Ignavibacteria bacterium RBG_16_34_14]